MKIVTLILLVFYTSFCSGQEYNFTNFNIKNGLAGSTAYCMLQDHDGFMWIGTETGLSKFDGQRFVNYSTQNGLPSNEILVLFEDSKNRIWIASFSKSISYYYKGKIYNQDNDSLLKKLKVTNFAIGFSEDKHGNVGIITGPELIVVNSVGGISIFGATKTGLGQFHSIGITPDGEFQIGAGAGLYNFNSNYGKFARTLDLNQFSQHVSYHNFQKAIKVWRKSQFTQTVSDSRYPNNGFDLPFSLNILKTLIIKDSVVAICTRSGVLLASTKDTVNKIFLLKDHLVTYALNDNEGNWWFSTMGQGIYKLSSQEILNYRFKSDLTTAEAFAGLCIKGSKLYGGTYVGNVYEFNWKKNSNILSSPVKHLTETELTIPVIRKIRDDKLMIASSVMMSIHDDAFKELKRKPYTSVKKVTFDSDTSLIAATSTSMLRIGIPGLSIIDTLLPNRTFSCYYFNGLIYYSNLNGLFVASYLNSKLGLSKQLLPSRSTITAIEGDGNGTVWSASLGEGVFVYKGDSLLKHLMQSNGIASNICKNIYVDKEYAWVCTSLGISRVSLKDFSISNYNESDGLISDNVNDITTSDGIVFASTSEGVSVFKNYDKKLRSKCLIRITEFLLNGKEREVPKGKMLLKHKENNIRIGYVGLSYTALGGLVYKYRLNGLDNGWNRTSQSLIEFSNLPSGDYEFQIVAINKEGLESEPLSITFSIEKGWMEFWYVRAIAALLVLLLGYLFIRWRINTNQKKLLTQISIQQRISELEQQVLRTQMNPHFVYNSLNSIQHFVIEKDVVGANKYIASFSRLLRKTLEYTNMPSITLKEELEFNENYLKLEKVRFEDKFEFEVNVDKTIDTSSLKLPPLLLQPYIENAVKHGVRYREDKLGKVVIIISKVNETINIQIRDNGIGFERSKRYREVEEGHQSKGLGLAKGRIEMLKAESLFSTVRIEPLETENLIYPGVVVEILIPIKLMLS